MNGLAFNGGRCVSAAVPTKLLKGRVFSQCPAVKLFLQTFTPLPGPTVASPDTRRTLAVVILTPG